MRGRPALLAAVCVALLSAVALTLVHRTPRLVVPRAAAIRAVLSDRQSGPILAGTHWTRVTVSAVDGKLERASFFDGDQIVAQFAIGRDGRVALAEGFKNRRFPYGDWIAYQPALLAGLAALFVLLTGVRPWRRMRNADVAAALLLLVPVLLLKERYVDASVLSAAAPMLYLALRCGWIALGRARPPAPSMPLLGTLLPGVPTARRVRLLRLLLIALALIYAMVGVSSTAAVDVVYAVMEGATKLIHGVLPYGHMPGDVIHGDTYPLLSYVLYAPLARVTPVRSVWDSVDGALAVAVAAALITACALFAAAAGPRRHRRARRAPEQQEAGLRAALSWLAFPPLLVVVSTGTTDVVLAATVTVALLICQRPGSSSAVLAAGAWFKLAPAALIPMWLAPLRGRRLAAALGAIAGVSAAMLLLLIGLGGVGGPGAMIRAVAFQFSRGSPQSLWSALGLESLQPLGQACVLGLVAGSTVRLRRAPELADDRVRMAGLTAAILLGLELTADYWAFLYIVWITPLLGMSLFAEGAAAASAERAPVAHAPIRGLAPALSAQR